MTQTPDAPNTGRFRAIVGYASLGLVLFLVIAGFRGFRDLKLASERERYLEAEIERSEVETRSLERRIDRLRDDPVLLERLAREELGMIRTGEVVVLVEPEQKRAAPVEAIAVTPKLPAPPSSDPPEPTSP